MGGGGYGVGKGGSEVMRRSGEGVGGGSRSGGGGEESPVWEGSFEQETCPECSVGCEYVGSC